MLGEKTIKALQEILREEYAREVSFAETSEIANSLVGYFDKLAEIRHREQVEDPENSMHAGAEFSGPSTPDA